MINIDILILFELKVIKLDTFFYYLKFVGFIFREERNSRSQYFLKLVFLNESWQASNVFSKCCVFLNNLRINILSLADTF